MTLSVFPSNDDILLFKQQGFLVARQLASPEKLKKLQATAERQLAAPTEPWELESSTGYPGAPSSSNAPGGKTLRRLLGAVDRDSSWSDWASGPELTTYLSKLFNSNTLYLNRSHHNCLMTKSPAFSSDTGWHQDVRYWHFSEPSLISVWTALGHETKQNGCLSLIPGSHNMDFAADQFDDATFFDAQAEQNQHILENEISVSLEPGDVLFFDCKLLHKATRNHTDDVKLSLVYTYHDERCHPEPNSRSSNQAELKIVVESNDND